MMAGHKRAGMTPQGHAAQHAAMGLVLGFGGREVIEQNGVAVNCASTAVDEVLDDCVIPAGAMGLHSALIIEPCWTYTSGTNNKILKIKIGAVEVFSRTRNTAGQLRDAPLIVLQNRGALNSQVAPYDGQAAYLAAAANGVATFSIDFSVAQIIQITGQRANAGDTLRKEYWSVSIQDAGG